MMMKIKMGSPDMMEDSESKEKEGFDKFEVQQALDTLMKAEEIKADKALMAEVEKERSKKEQAIRSIKDLKAASSKVQNAKEEATEPVDSAKEESAEA